jgi:dipeptidyl aminopeptidase/acylaminoacyl peptidase
VEVLSWLSSVADYLDMERVAIHGWSYGGYLSLMALVQYPEVFKVSCRVFVLKNIFLSFIFLKLTQ